MSITRQISPNTSDVPPTPKEITVERIQKEIERRCGKPLSIKECDEDCQFQIVGNCFEYGLGFAYVNENCETILVDEIDGKLIAKAWDDENCTPLDPQPNISIGYEVMFDGAFYTDPFSTFEEAMAAIATLYAVSEHKSN